MKRILLVVAVLALAAGGFFGWQAWSSRNGGAVPSGATGAITEKIKSLAAKVTAPDEEQPVRCRVGKSLQLLRRFDCAQRGGLVAEDGGSGEYTKLSKDEMETRFGKPAAAKKGPEPSPEEAAAAAENAH